MASPVDLSSMKNGFSVFKDLDVGKLPKLISRIAQSISNGSKIEEAFSAEESSQLEEVLGLDTDGVGLLLKMISQCLLYAAYHGMKPQVLAEQLGEYLDEALADIFSQAWQKYGKEIIATLKNNTISTNQLKSVDWHLNLQVAQGSKSRIAEPNVVFQLEAGDEGSTSRLMLEMNHEELLNFYSKLETIQEQLDALS